ncbi:MAG TPA: hypothetical protein PKZ76_16940 [Xanthomonadaceae bacterium]|nr:hypothetical protein [Xanthomonadaceae bacterium]
MVQVNTPAIAQSAAKPFSALLDDLDWNGMAKSLLASRGDASTAEKFAGAIPQQP